LIIEDQVFQLSSTALPVIDADMMLMERHRLGKPDSYPTDVRLLYKAFERWQLWPERARSRPWWDQPHVKQRWRASNLNQKDRLAYLREFSTLFVPAFASFNEHLDHLPKSPLRQRWSHLLEVLRLLHEQTQQQLAGESHI